MNATLFSRCPIPGCSQLTDDPREPCQDCRAAFGSHLTQSSAPASAPEVFAAAIARRDAEMAAILAERRLIRALNGEAS